MSFTSVDGGEACCCSPSACWHGSAFSLVAPDGSNNGEEASDKKSCKSSGVSSDAEDT